VLTLGAKLDSSSRRGSWSSSKSSSSSSSSGASDERQKQQQQQQKHHVQRIGRLVTTSDCVWSVADKQVVFRHQKKEEDYKLRPDWEALLQAEHANVGAANVDRLINVGLFDDLETK
jgi:hypothetical protein